MSEYILSLSYGKDSLACLGAIQALGWPLDRIVHAEVWATDTIPADLPPMVVFKAKADKIIKDRWGIEVEHICTKRNKQKWTYEKGFYRVKNEKSYRAGSIVGWPFSVRGAWCNGELKKRGFAKIERGNMCYMGIASDEPERIARHKPKENVLLPLEEIGWDEAYCREWCERNGLLSPIYTDSARGGCWFCHNQGVEQLRLLRKNYPEYWKLMLKWDKDSPVTFKADGKTVWDYERRFALEDEGLIYPGEPFRWDMLERELNLRWF